MLGDSLRVNSIGLGCMGITHAFGTPLSKKEGMKVISEAYDMGYDFFDTAECYTGIYPDGSSANNEEIVGEALRSVRDKVVIATKFGVHHGDGCLIMDSRPSVIRSSVEGSLSRLGTDYIDLYYQHRIDPKVAPEEVAEVMAGLIEEGKIRCWGISEANEEYLRRAHAVCPVTAVQNRYSMMARWHENLFPVLEELHISFVAFSPLANGFLSGRYNSDCKFEIGTDYRSIMPQYTKDGFERGHELSELLNEISRKINVTPAQVSLAWMLQKKPYIIPIPGSRKTERLKENMNASCVRLDTEDINRIDALLDSANFLVFGGH